MKILIFFMTALSMNYTLIQSAALPAMHKLEDGVVKYEGIEGWARQMITIWLKDIIEPDDRLFNAYAGSITIKLGELKYKHCLTDTEIETIIKASKHPNEIAKVIVNNMLPEFDRKLINGILFICRVPNSVYLKLIVVLYEFYNLLPPWHKKFVENIALYSLVLDKIEDCKDSLYNPEKMPITQNFDCEKSSGV